MDERGGARTDSLFFPGVVEASCHRAEYWLQCSSVAHTAAKTFPNSAHALRSSPGLESDWSHARGCMETFTENLHLRVADAARHFLYLHRRGAVQVLGCM